MGEWKLETAKAKLSEVVRHAKADGPQTITVRGAETAVLLSIEDYRRLKGPPLETESWVDRIRAACCDPDGEDFVFEREPDYGRDFEF
jgi:antitoxin Phd